MNTLAGSAKRAQIV